MNIAVFLSQYDMGGKYTDVTERLGNAIAKSGNALVWGGHDEGLMGLIAKTVQHGGGRIIGVMRKGLTHKAFKGADEMYIVEDEHEMNTGLIARGDYIVVLPGGIGTLNELTAVVRMYKNRTSSKPTVVVNTDDFYAGLKTQLKRMTNEGFIRKDVADAITFVDTPEEAMRYIEAHA